MVTWFDVTVPLAPGAEAVAVTVTGAAVGDRFACVTRNACPVQLPPVVFVIPASAVLDWSTNAHVAVLLMSVPDGPAMAWRQKGVPELADTDCEDGVTLMVETGTLTDTVAEPLTDPLLAVMVAVPVPTAVTNPLADTVATFCSSLPQNAFPVMSFGGLPLL